MTPSQENKGKQKKLRFYKKVHKYVEYIVTRLHLLLHQKVFTFENTSLKYLLNLKDSESLVVVFSACTRKGLRARYNYVRTLKNVNANQLFILDDFAKDHRGGYYIGSNYTFQEEKATKELITDVMKHTKAKKVILCGSSKGGWAALNFGFQIENSYIVVGAPQYYLATYLIEDNSLITLDHIIGSRTPEKIRFIDEYLKNRILHHSLKIPPHIYMHFSNQEHTFFEHIEAMVEDLGRANLSVQYDIADYQQHSEISYYFPDFLIHSIEKILKEA